MTTISIDIDDQVKEHFNKFIEKHGASISVADIKEAKSKIAEIRSDSSDGYIIDQVSSLEMMLTMAEDKVWEISNANKEKINATIKYFVDEDDVIPDNIPGLGYLDDCIVIDSTRDIVNDELLEYKDFCRSRLVYAQNKKFTLGDWKKIKDQEVTSRARNRRYRKSKRSRGW